MRVLITNARYNIFIYLLNYLQRRINKEKLMKYPFSDLTKIVSVFKS